MMKSEVIHEKMENLVRVFILDHYHYPHIPTSLPIFPPHYPSPMKSTRQQQFPSLPQHQLHTKHSKDSKHYQPKKEKKKTTAYFNQPTLFRKGQTDRLQCPTGTLPHHPFDSTQGPLGPSLCEGGICIPVKVGVM